MAEISQDLVEECRKHLLALKSEILNQMMDGRHQLTDRETRGDPADICSRILEEADFVTSQERLQKKLLQIESALSRIENGQFGICEETEEPIEEGRLRAIPWTTLSIEGAELRESER